jgi:hypothetical protein
MGEPILFDDLLHHEHVLALVPVMPVEDTVYLLGTRLAREHRVETIAVGGKVDDSLVMEIVGILQDDLHVGFERKLIFKK